MTAPIILWLRRDLRLSDNPALLAALTTKRPIIPLFILEPDDDTGAAALWWLHHSLESLTRDLASKGSRLILRRGSAQAVLNAVQTESGAAGMVFARHPVPVLRQRDLMLAQDWRARGLIAEETTSNLLFEPGSILTKSGTPFRVFTAYWNACRQASEPARPAPAPHELPPCPSLVSEAPEDWSLRPTKPDWSGGLQAIWQPGEAGAQKRLADFLSLTLENYHSTRNLPALPHGTSRLSPHLHWGEISVRQVWHAIPPTEAGAEKFLAELGWREFSHELLNGFPALPIQPLDPRFARFPWRHDPEGLRAWQKGQTGFPIVDAGLRELWHTGWMHNRVRMIAASFLIKDLLIPWQDGAAWFRETLVDADEASNAASWQWVAGCGADAAPFFRIFNPVLQGQKFDPDGAYVRRWCPELAHLPADKIHLLSQPIVDHGTARARALAALASLKT